MKITKIHIWEYLYTFFWSLFLMGTAFPCIFYDCDFSFLTIEYNGETMSGISKAYIFAMTMIFVVHLLDMSHVVISDNRINAKKMKLGLLATLFSVILIASSLVFISVVENQSLKIGLFMAFWIILFVYKLVCINMSKQTSESESESENERLDKILME